MNLNHAIQLLSETLYHREKHYGSIGLSFKLAADIANAACQKGSQPPDVLKTMIAVKLSRLQQDECHVDSWLDIAGYALIGMCLADNEVKAQHLIVEDVDK